MNHQGIEQEMEKLKLIYEQIPEKEHTDREKLEYANRQLYLMNYLLSNFKGKYSFKDRMLLKGGIFVLEKLQKHLMHSLGLDIPDDE